MAYIVFVHEFEALKINYKHVALVLNIDKFILEEIVEKPPQLQRNNEMVGYQRYNDKAWQ